MTKLIKTSGSSYLIISLIILFSVSCKKQETLPDVNANFVGDATTILVGETVTLTDLSSGEPNDWKWEFEGGNPSNSTEQTPSVAYLNPGTYSVKLTSANSQNSDIEIKDDYIKVYPRLNADFNGNKTAILIGDTVEFTDLSTGDATTWDWEFEGGEPPFSIEQNPKIIYTNPGNYSIKLTSGNSHDTNTEIKVNFITVLSQVSASFTLSDSVVSQGDKIIITDTSEAEAAEWLWEFEGGNPASSTDRNPEVTFSESGIFTIKLTVSNLLSSSSVTKKVISMPIDQLVAHYPFNGNPKDATGNGHDGIAMGNVSLAYDRYGVENSAYEFDGINDLILTSSTFDYASRTLSLWINPYDLSGFETTAKVAITQDDYQLDYGILRVEFSNNSMKLWAGGKSGIYTRPDVQIGSWIHLVLIRDNDVTKYYVDNLHVYTSIADNYASDFEANPFLIIGAGRSTYKQYFKGKIDDIRIYRKALNEKEIQTLYLGR